MAGDESERRAELIDEDGMFMPSLKENFQLIDKSQDSDVVRHFLDVVNDDTIQEERSTRNHDSSLNSNGSEKERKGVRQDIMTIDSVNKQGSRYKRKAPELTKPYLNELLLAMNETKQRLFKFVDDRGHYSELSLMQFIDLEKRVIKEQRPYGKKGKLKEYKLTTEEKANIKIGDDQYLTTWPVPNLDGSREQMPGIVTEKKLLWLQPKKKDFSELSLPPKTLVGLDKILNSDNFEKRDEFITDLTRATRAVNRYGQFSSGTGVEEAPPPKRRLFDETLGESQSHYLEPYDVNEEWDNEEMARMLKALGFPFPERTSTNKKFVDEFYDLIQSEFTRQKGTDYQPSPEFTELKAVWSNPALAILKTR